MPGTEIGKAYVQIVPSAEGIKGSVGKVLKGEAESAGKGAGLKVASFMKKAIAAAGIGVAIKKSLDAGKELEQNLGGTEAVFGDFASKIQEEAKTAYKNMGLSASDYMATANKMGSLFQGSGVSQQKSLELTTAAMKRASDVASVMGIDTTMAMESIAGAAKGNFTMMDNLGVAMNATTLEAYALEKGVNFKWNTASNAEKAELAMKMFMDRTSQYEGNFYKESEGTFAGSLDAMKASLQNFMGNLALGQSVNESMGELIDAASTFFFGNCIPMIGTMVKALPGAISVFIRKGIPVLLNNIGSMVRSLATNVSKFANSITAEKVEAWAKTSGIKMLKKGGEFLQKFVSGILSNMGKLLRALAQIGLEIIKGLGSAIWPKITAAANGIKERFLAPINALKLKVASSIQALKESFVAKINSIKGWVGGAAASIKEKFLSPITSLRDRIKAIVDKIKGFFKFKVSTPHIPKPHFSVSPPGWKLGDLLKGSIPRLGISWHAEGVIFKRPTVLHGFGEAGPEATLPISKLDSMVNQKDNIDYDKLATALINGLKGLNMTSVLEVDGREVARSTAPFMKNEINRLDTRANRKLGYI